MKKLKYIFCVVLVSFGLSSCDLDTEHPYALSNEAVFTTLNNADYVLNGAWKNLWDPASYTVSSPGYITTQLASDFLGSDVVECGRYGWAGTYQYTDMLSGTSAQTTRIWTNAYFAINNCNAVINNIDIVPITGTADETKRDRIKAQAYAIRGYLYLDLGTYYANGYHNPTQLAVPIYTEESSRSSKGNPRSTLAQVYKQAEDDLIAAYGLIGSYDRKTSKQKVNKNVISGLLARLYLYMGDWTNAQKYAAEAHASYAWMSTTEYLNGFNEASNSEWIWGHLQNTTQNTASSGISFKNVTSTSYYYNMMCDPYFMDDLFAGATDTDIRYKLFEWGTNSSMAPGYLRYKKFRYRSTGDNADVVIMRKAEMVLIEAEAYAEMNMLTEAITALNSLRTARNAATPDLSSLSKADLIEEILKERRKELWGEGFSIVDIKRRQKAVDRRDYPATIIGSTTIKTVGHTTRQFSDGSPFVPNSPLYNFVIPTSEYTNNPNL